MFLYKMGSSEQKKKTKIKKEKNNFDFGVFDMCKKISLNLSKSKNS